MVEKDRRVLPQVLMNGRDHGCPKGSFRCTVGRLQNEMDCGYAAAHDFNNLNKTSTIEAEATAPNHANED